MEGNKGEKKWDNCNSVINKIYLKKEMVAKGYLIAEGLEKNGVDEVQLTLGSATFSAMPIPEFKCLESQGIPECFAEMTLPGSL